MLIEMNTVVKIFIVNMIAPVKENGTVLISDLFPLKSSKCTILMVIDKLKPPMILMLNISQFSLNTVMKMVMVLLMIVKFILALLIVKMNGELNTVLDILMSNAHVHSTAQMLGLVKILKMPLIKPLNMLIPIMIPLSIIMMILIMNIL